MKVKTGSTVANYFGVLVEVLIRMEICSLIRFQGQEFIVDTRDLVFSRTFRQVA